ncbi:MAG TPA: hypothetical protein VF940_13000, partial [Streptosporangiaceae bacterium]
ARVAVIAAPILAYIITKRICLGLQRKDLHLLQHGVETGIIKQLPNGEFIEETRPLDEEALAKLALPERLELPGGPTAAAEEEVPPPGLRGGVGRVKARLNKVLTESVPMNGHGNGHRPDGHGADGQGERAAISAPDREGRDHEGGSDQHG